MIQALSEKLLPALTGLVGVYVGTLITTRSQEKLARLNREHQLRTSALEKRLDKHQEAFTLWWRLVGDLHSDTLHTTAVECQTWWGANCVFLSPDIADRFVKTYQAATNHANLKAIWRESGGAVDAKRLEENFDFICDTGPKIRAAVQLPEVGTHELPPGASAFGTAQ